MKAVHENMQQIIDSKVHEKVTLANKDMHAKFEEKLKAHIDEHKQSMRQELEEHK